MTKSWDKILQELDHWHKMGLVAELWLRDDDAIEPTAALDCFLNIIKQEACLLAVIPKLCTIDLAQKLTSYPGITVIQHGWMHEMCAQESEKKSEFPASRTIKDRLNVLQKGRKRLISLFNNQFKPVLVPPWNRISNTLKDHLPTAGYYGLSCYQQDPSKLTQSNLFLHAPHFTQIDTVIDIIDWKGTRGLMDETHLLSKIHTALVARRSAISKNDNLQSMKVKNPLGFLTHHLVHDKICWYFLETLFAKTTTHPACIWSNPFAVKQPE